VLITTSSNGEARLFTQQLGVGVPGGAEAAVNAARRLVGNLPVDHVIVKLIIIIIIISIFV